MTQKHWEEEDGDARGLRERHMGTQSMVNTAMEKSIDYKIYDNLSKKPVRNKPKLSAELS